MSKRKTSTIAALLEEKPKRGRPRRPVSRQNVYVSLTQKQKQLIQFMADGLSEGLVRADIPDMAINLLSVRLEVLRQAVADRDREIPEGITDLESLYLLWDLPLHSENGESKWTSIRLSPQRVIELGRVRGVLNALFGVNRSQVFSLSLVLFNQFLNNDQASKQADSLDDIIELISSIYL
jgi:hypothetical protein